METYVWIMTTYLGYMHISENIILIQCHTFKDAFLEGHVDDIQSLYVI